MNCQTSIGNGEVCGHSLMRHEGDESGMGAPEPCMLCACENFSNTKGTGTYVPPQQLTPGGPVHGGFVVIETEEEPLRCPTCKSRQPTLHPAVQPEGEVQPCKDRWHNVCTCGRHLVGHSMRCALIVFRKAHAQAGTEFPEGDSGISAAVLDESGNEWSTAPKAAQTEEDPWATGSARVAENKTVQKWADTAMFGAEKIDAGKGPQVYLLGMTPDPLGVIAAVSKMYKGETVRSYSDVTHHDRLKYFEEINKTHLKAPFEFVQFHFVFEGVTRAFTHQLVRQRTATYAQRSDRFAVQEDGIDVGLPPSLSGTKGARATWATEDFTEAERQREKWDTALQGLRRGYEELIASGMPQEDARGLLPTNLLTAVHYRTDLRALIEHAGNRLCTQAQFEWRIVISKMIAAIRNYNPYAGLMDRVRGFDGLITNEIQHVADHDRWQYRTIADMFRPICYLTGKCEFASNLDRKCNIRDRVDAFHAKSIPSSQWGPDQCSPDRECVHSKEKVQAIEAFEWLLDPGAAR